MIYRRPLPEDRLDQGDIINSCPLLSIEQLDQDSLDVLDVGHDRSRTIVLTQTCDLVGEKTSRVLVARVFAAHDLVSEGILKPGDIRGPLRGGRVFGWYFLPHYDELGLPEMIVDLRQLHTVPLELLVQLCQRGHRQARLQPLYREHLAKHFADSYSRIGLPTPCETL